MATQNQNTTSNPSTSRPAKNDSQVGGRNASTGKSWEEKVDDASGYKTERDSRGTISPSTSDDVSSMGASSTQVHEAPQRKTQPDFDKTQDPQINVVGEPDDYQADVNAANSDLDLQADKQAEGSQFNSKDKDLDFNTTSITGNNSSSPKLSH